MTVERVGNDRNVCVCVCLSGMEGYWLVALDRVVGDVVDPHGGVGRWEASLEE